MRCHPRRQAVTSIASVAAGDPCRGGPDRCAIGRVTILGFGPTCCYLAVAGGLDVPDVIWVQRRKLHAGRLSADTRPVRVLARGDMLRIGDAPRSSTIARPVPDSARPRTGAWLDRCTCCTGHPWVRAAQTISFAPERASTTLFSTPNMTVHFNSESHGRAPDRSPSPNGARSDGGEAGLHPSNIHDNAYAVGAHGLHRRHADHPGTRTAPAWAASSARSTIVAGAICGRLGQLAARAIRSACRRRHRSGGPTSFCGRPNSDVRNWTGTTDDFIAAPDILPASRRDRRVQSAVDRPGSRPAGSEVVYRRVGRRRAAGGIRPAQRPGHLGLQASRPTP